jgi:beta-lactamase regulating signal transducer with metallopeptidase domain
MMLAVLAESALRSLVLGGAVWVGLKLFRVRNPHVQMTCWVMVLLASLAMPLLMHWTTLTITRNALPLPAPEHLWSTGSSFAESLDSTLSSDIAAPLPTGSDTHQTVNWFAVATAGYTFVAAMLLLRLALGVHLTWRLVRAARPMHEPWAGKWRVRVSNLIGGPVTFGSTILLPPQCFEWDPHKRQAVLAHEGAHVTNRDFYVLLLASLNRAMFWFSPFAWWQLGRLAELAELISDARALQVVEDRLSYAEILLDLVQSVRRAPAGLEMARACTVRARVERILSATAPPAKLGWGKRAGTIAAIIPVVVVSAGSIAYTTQPVSTPTLDSATAQPAGKNNPEALSFYSFGPGSIFTVFREGDGLFGQLSGQRKLRLAVAGDGAYFYPAAVGGVTLPPTTAQQRSEPVLNQNGRDIRAVRIADLALQARQTGPRELGSYTGRYQLTPSRVLTVSRDSDRLYVQETGQTKFELAARAADAFSDGHDEFVLFLRDGQANVTQVLLQEPLSGARLAPRVSDSMAKAVEEEFARRIAQVPDRFREQTPLPDSKDAILRGIEDLKRGAPNYDRMSAPLAAKIRRQASELQAMFTALGSVEAIYFRGVGPGGYDAYGVKFTNGVAEIRMLLAMDGRAEDVLFRADGNDAVGDVVACSNEQVLRGRPDTSPVHLFLYNNTEADIQLYRLGPEGKRTAHGTIGGNMSSSVLTTVESPWVVADASGKCLEIVLPGQRTRYHVVEGAGGDGLSRRTAPLAASEPMLRQYIEALGRGEPNYDRMTAEVAAQTRQRLPFNQAIVSRLGALRALTFRGVSNMGSDIYMAHFVNGTAEWRIGLAKDGMIARVALGPQ